MRNCARKALCCLVAVVGLHICPSSPIVPAAPAMDEALIRHDFYKYAAARPYFILKNQIQSFKKKYQKRFGKAATYVVLAGKYAVFLLKREQVKDRALSVFKPKSPGVRPPFVFFDPTYNDRLRAGYTSAKDLISGYKDARLNEKLLTGVVKKNPDIARLHVIGTTSLGRKILALEIHNFAAKPKKTHQKKIPVLFSCTMHADELTATEHCYSVIYSILKDRAAYADILQNVNLWIIPLVNPDGSHLFWHTSTVMGRKNGRRVANQGAHSPLRGVDLNRNFPFQWNSGHPKASSDNPNSFYFRGEEPGSEAETRAIMKLADRERFVYAISFHAAASKLLIPYTIENVKNPEPDYASALAHELVKVTKSHHIKHAFRAAKNLYPVDGTDQDFLYFKYGTLAYILETTYNNCEYRYVQYYLQGYRALWQSTLRDYEQNFKFSLRITNEKGQPVEAAVEFSDLTWLESEKHTSSPRDGTFIRMTKNPEPVKVTVVAPGYVTTRISIEPQGKGYPAFLPIVLRLPVKSKRPV